MTKPTEMVSLLIVLKFVVISSIVLLLVPLKAAAPLIPLLLVFVIVLHLYWL